MYIIFLQNRVSRLVNIVYTNIFAKIYKLQKIANTNSNFEKNYLSNIHHRIT